MVGREILGSVLAVSALVPASRTADASGDIIDLQGFEACMIVFHAGVLGGATTPTLLEADDTTTTFTAVAAANMVGGLFVAATASAVQSRAYKGSKRYLRLIDDHADASADLTSAVYLLSNARHVPVS